MGTKLKEQHSNPSFVAWLEGRVTARRTGEHPAPWVACRTDSYSEPDT